MTRKVIIGKKLICQTLLSLTESMIKAAYHPDTDELGKEYAHANATLLLELAKRELK